MSGIEFYDVASGRNMKYIYPDADSQWAGWICYKNPGDGRWVSLRKATGADVTAITSAVVSAHHQPDGARS